MTNHLFHMKTRPIIISGMLVIALGLEGRNLDLSTHLSAVSAPRKTAIKPLSTTATTTHRVIITLDSEADTGLVRDLGITPELTVGRNVTATVTASQLSVLDTLGSVTRVSAVRRKRLLMDKARQASGVDKIRNDAAYAGFDGKDVVIGIIDAGFDPNHITFSDADGTARVKRFWNYDSSGNVTEYTAGDISTFTSDDISECHATHVSGIAAGSYDNLYAGVAPGADIVMAAGDLGDDMVLSAVSKMIGYARSVDKPLVINMSIGDNLGPHDGTDAFTSSLDDLAEDAVICVAAGNEGNYDITVKKSLTASDRCVRTVLMPNSELKSFSSLYQAYCDVKIWSDDNTPFKAYVAFVNKSTGEVVDRAEASETTQVFSAGDAEVSGSYLKTLSENFADSYFAMAQGLSRENNRYHCELSFDLSNRTSSPTVYPALIVEGSAGQTIRIYNDGWYTDFSDRSFPGYDPTTADGTVSNMACGRNTISVGAFVTKRLAPYLAGFTVGKAAYFTSWGTLVDGRQLPQISAPGVAVVSALSSPHARSRYYSSYDTPKTLTEKVGGKDYFWTPMGGTSMATPFVTGTVALWLQAAPSMTPSQIGEIATSTADMVSDGNPQWGAGKLNAFEGLRSAVRMAGVSDVAAGCPDMFTIETCRNEVIVGCIDDTPFTAAVFDLSGRLADKADNVTGAVTLHVPSAAGLYLLSVTGRKQTLTRKITIR